MNEEEVKVTFSAVLKNGEKIKGITDINKEWEEDKNWNVFIGNNEVIAIVRESEILYLIKE